MMLLISKQQQQKTETVSFTSLTHAHVILPPWSFACMLVLIEDVAGPLAWDAKSL